MGTGTGTGMAEHPPFAAVDEPVEHALLVDVVGLGMGVGTGVGVGVGVDVVVALDELAA